MGWEERNGKRYYYRKRRIGNRVVSEYVGGGEIGDLVAELDAIERRERRAERAACLEERNHDLEIARGIDAVGDRVLALTRAVLLANGYHTHKGQWKKIRKSIS